MPAAPVLVVFAPMPPDLYPVSQTSSSARLTLSNAVDPLTLSALNLLPMPPKIVLIERKLKTLVEEGGKKCLGLSPK